MDKREYKSCTPANIASMTDDEILALAKTLSDYQSPVRVRMKILQHIYQLLGFSLSKDLLLALVSDVRQQLILACAGGCKTTSSQLVITLAKIMWHKTYGRHLTQSEILCLVYNRENRPQMDKKHSELLTPLVMSGFLSLDSDKPSFINAGITSHTLHSFCLHWIGQYLPELGMAGYTIAKDGDSAVFFNSAIRNVSREDDPYGKDEIKAERVQTLYDLVHGLCLSYDDVSEKNVLLSEAVMACNATADQIKKIFRLYDSQKAFLKRYDFTDMLTGMDRLLDKDGVRARMHALYSFVVVDEIQDFTPLMMRILKKLISPTARLLAIGDEDQSIYGFRGADVNNAVGFKEHFPDSKVFQLLVNRRCGKNILDSAASVIELNANRYDKELVAERSGGRVSFVPYTGLDCQMANIVDMITATKREDQDRTVVSVREKAFGAPITYALFANRVPFHTLNAYSFVYHEAFKGFVEIMNLLWKPVRDNWRNFYKIINIKRADWFAFIGFNEKKQRPEKHAETASLFGLDFSEFRHYAGLTYAIDQLRDIHENINSRFCADYIEYVIKLFKQNHWLTRVGMESVLFAEEVFDWIRGVYGKTSPYPVLHESFADQMQRMRSDEQYKSGVAVATMHALKGLEFKNVHLAFMRDSLFPAFDSIDTKGYGADVALSLKEAENRLAYVAMTRARDDLFMHYDESDPSYYVTLLNGGSDTDQSGGGQLIFSNKKDW